MLNYGLSGKLELCSECDIRKGSSKKHAKSIAYHACTSGSPAASNVKSRCVDCTTVADIASGAFRERKLKMTKLSRVPFPLLS